MFEFLLKTQTWSDIDQRDAFYVRCAYHLRNWLLQMEATLQRRQANFSLPPAGIGVKTKDSCLSQLPEKVLSAFWKVLQFDKGATDMLSKASVAADQCERLVLAGHEMHEAGTEQELLELAQKFIPTYTGLRLVNGAHIHGLLVMDRLRRGLPVCYKVLPGVAPNLD